ncbi:hypothetical protein BST97_09295 [Nonlabens spongiae]|uniref:Uncharacterized protein n=1 Tax=Nonlabens spongiae TaxID=331648 RepID=A0A1W6MKR3_9FLAO|nr:hypothetical protein BST97_09295 [Nonlabens spongiae]
MGKNELYGDKKSKLQLKTLFNQENLKTALDRDLTSRSYCAIFKKSIFTNNKLPYESSHHPHIHLLLLFIIGSRIE